MTSGREADWVNGCKNQERKTQQLVFEHYAGKMLGVCCRYVSNKADAEDVMMEGFFKVFTQIHQYKGNGSFEGWIRRIMVNEALMYLRKNKNLYFEDGASIERNVSENPSDYRFFEENEEVLFYLEKLPTGYRTIFNMFVLEGYKHHEIAEILGISENTSKTQLMMAKEKIKLLWQQRHQPAKKN